VALLLGALAACGPREDTRPAVAAPSPPRETQGSPAASVQAPARGFDPQSTAVGEAYHALAARLDPATDRGRSGTGPGEAFAHDVERALTAAFAALLEGDSGPWAQLAGPRVVFLDAAPAGAVARDAHGVRVLRRETAAGEPGGHAELGRALDAWAAPLRGGSRRRVRVEVLHTGLESPEADGAARVRPTARARVRLAADVGPSAELGVGPGPGAGARQLELTLALAWRAGDGPPRVVRCEVEALDDVHVAARAFVDATRSALAGAPRALAALDEDALALLGRVDNVVPPSLVALGMHGLAVGDVDGDGLEDLYVCRVAGAPNLLLLAQPGGGAREAAAEAGVDLLDDCAGALIVDLDGDGARDLALARGTDVWIGWNDGSGRFPTGTTLRADGGARVYSLAAADVDGDGDLDLYDTRYFRQGGYGDQAPTPYHNAENGAANHFWRNLSESAQRVFRDDTAAIGLDAANDRFSLAAAFEDIDGDGDLDLYVANDFGRNNLFVYDGERFVDRARELGLEDMAAGMGVSFGDFDRDGRSDLLVSNMWAPAGLRVARDPRFVPGAPGDVRTEFMRHARGNSLFRARADGRFEDVTDVAGVGPGGWCWGARLVDVDRDGWLDVVAPSGFLTGRRGPDLASFFWREVVGASPLAPPASPAYLAAWATISRLSQEERYDWNAREPMYGHLNLGAGRFVDASAALGLDVLEDGRALVVCDWDGDGALDLWTRNRSAPALRLHRGAPAADTHWVSFELVGRAPNTDAVGALVELEAGGVVRRERVRAGDGFLSGSSLRAHFGLGRDMALGAVRVRWPDGQVSDVRGARVDAHWRLVEPAAGGPVEALFVRGQGPSLAESERLDDRPRPPRTRVPLLDTFPLGAARLAPYQGVPARIDALTGARGLAVLVWHAGVPESARALEALAARRAALEARGLAVFCVALDDPADGSGPAARAVAERAGLGARAGRADRATRLVLDMLLGRTLAPFEDIPLPLTLLFDPVGELGCIQVGALDLDALAEDAARLADRPTDPATGERTRWPTGLTGGRWGGAPPRRTLPVLAKRLREVGLPELADGLATAHDRRGD